MEIKGLKEFAVTTISSSKNIWNWFKICNRRQDWGIVCTRISDMEYWECMLTTEGVKYD